MRLEAKEMNETFNERYTNPGKQSIPKVYYCLQAKLPEGKVFTGV